MPRKLALLRAAVVERHIRMIRLLIESGANLSMDVQGGRIFRGLRGPASTALYAASALRNVRLFVESGADVNVREEKYGVEPRLEGMRMWFASCEIMRQRISKTCCNTDSISRRRIGSCCRSRKDNRGRACEYASLSGLLSREEPTPDVRGVDCLLLRTGLSNLPRDRANQTLHREVLDRARAHLVAAGRTRILQRRESAGDYLFII
jgi:hypothetical protein